MNTRHRVELEEDERRPRAGVNVARKIMRARIPLAVTAGRTYEEIAGSTQVGTSTVSRTKRRLVEESLDAAPRGPAPGGPREIPGAKKRRRSPQRARRRRRGAHGRWHSWPTWKWTRGAPPRTTRAWPAVDVWDRAGAHHERQSRPLTCTRWYGSRLGETLRLERAGRVDRPPERRPARHSSPRCIFHQFLPVPAVLPPDSPTVVGAGVRATAG